MKSQNEIIHETEMAIEKCRRAAANFKEVIADVEIKKSFSSLENTLFKCVVLLYTHKAIWSQKVFWDEYCESVNSFEFAHAAYQQMINGTLTTIYSDIYFEIEHALYKYFSLNGFEIKRDEGNPLSLYLKLYKNLIPNYCEIKSGLRCLRNVRNSFHGNMGKYTFTRSNETIMFKNQAYEFKSGKPSTCSYLFLRDFIPCIIEIYCAIFNVGSLRSYTTHSSDSSEVFL